MVYDFCFCCSFPTAGDIHYSVKTVSAFSGKHSDGDDKKPSDITRRGSASIADAMMLLKSNESMHAPYTQVSPTSTHQLTLSLCGVLLHNF